ncbi:General amino acid permease AGP3 [Fonsecaea nubica]|uniref:Carboxylic ester hydrolase n=1 Tax=Fonsecaea nubica TaxID=856822 RepID=A0A178DAL5_9EURO|nr:General amino acid permease AGP3 [Fonsecaea nubica]OAL38796.1 General amino acid permease AGP3 [Fonsecaea nubica]
MSLKVFCLLTAVLMAVSPAWAVLPRSTSDIQKILPGGATVLRTVSLGPNSTFGDVNEVAYPRNSTGLPALCAATINVTSSTTSSFRFGLYLPQEWNARFAAVGTGGIDGGINWPAMGPMFKYGFAVASTDTGHNSTNSSATWALRGPETVADWAYRAIHGSTVLAKHIVSGYYAAPIKFFYYNGCSTGGFQTSGVWSVHGLGWFRPRT